MTQDNVDNVKSDEYLSEYELSEIVKELEDLRWHHAWYEVSYNKNELENQGLKTDNNYDGVARYCKCYKCRPDNYDFNILRKYKNNKAIFDIVDSI